jgi:CheY-like chemotaxis protein
MDESAKQRVLKLIRDALNHLQDPGFLRHSPLASLLNVADRPNTPTALRDILVEAITALEPPGSQSSDSRAWRVYESVFYRYVEGFEQEDVAAQLGVSVRQLRREQRDAFEAIAFDLWNRFDLEAKLQAIVLAQGPSEDWQGQFPLDGNLAWLSEAEPEAVTDLAIVLPAVMRLLQPLATQRAVTLALGLEDALPPLGIDAVAVRQALLNLLSVAIRRASPGHVLSISAGSTDEGIALRIGCEAADAAPDSFSEEERASLDLAERIVSLCSGATIDWGTSGAFDARILWPCIESLVILAIDDNAEMIQLMQRFTAGTRYRLIGLRDPEHAVSQASRLAPQLILLDVMMPKTDGWEVLERLRTDPLTREIAILVCTILPQEELALSLGASGFLRKPIMRDDFLAALDRYGAPPV